MTLLTQFLKWIMRIFILNNGKTGNEGVGRKTFVGTYALASLCALGIGILIGNATKSITLASIFLCLSCISFFIPQLKPWVYKSFFFMALGAARIALPYIHQAHAEFLFKHPLAEFSGTVTRRTGYWRGFSEGFMITISTPQSCAGWPVIIYSPKLLVPGDTITTPLIKLKTVNQEAVPSYCMFLLKEGAYAVGTLPTKSIVDKTHRSSWQEFLYKKYDGLVRSSCKHFGKKMGSLLNTLFLGTRDAFPDFELRETFNRWGIAHYLARSGLHIVILMYAWLTVLSYLPIHLICRRFFTLLLALFYYILTIPSISFTRAVVLFLLINSALIFNKKPHGLHILTLICFLTLIINPFHLFFLDFQLTFALTYSLIGSKNL